MDDDPKRENLPWTLDEYLVVADLYLRRGRSSNANDPEVRELARLTGRSTGSISWRVGNFQRTAEPGRGLKPVTGDAFIVFHAMVANEALRVGLVADARRRLMAGLPSEPVELPAAAVLVAPERMLTTDATVNLVARVEKRARAESRLVQRYIKWRDPLGTVLRTWLLPTEESTLRTDLYDTERSLLIEAKAEPGRESIRYAIGQLFDYRRYLTPRPRLALLLSVKPSLTLIELLTEHHIGLITPVSRGFKEELV